MREQSETTLHEQFYEDGYRAALVAQLRGLVRELGYDSPEWNRLRWIKEREECIAILRGICADHGDNRWNPTDYLPDILEKHLADPLSSPPP